MEITTAEGAAVMALLEEDRSRKITKSGLARVREALYTLGLPAEDCNSITAALGYTPGLFEGLS